MKKTIRILIKNNGFTLIELLVVISIISLLSSVVLASLSVARVKAQNATRMQSVYQMNNAINLYLADYGHAPLLDGICGSEKFTESPVPYRRCIAVQTASTGEEKDAWDALARDLSPYMKSLPVDPCGANCTDMGYVYMSPSAIYYGCYKNSDECDVKNVSESSYQVYNKLDGSGKFVGFSTIGGYFDPKAITNPY